MITRLLLGLTLALGLLLTPPAQAQFSEQATWATAASSGSANAQTITIANATALTDLLGVPIRFVPGNNNSSATTLAVSGLAATAMRKPTTAGLAALSGGELLTGQPVEVFYNGTFFVILSTINTLPTPEAPVSTTQVLTTGTGATYTTPSGPAPRQLRIRMIAGGGGGAARDTNNGVVGGNTIFNSINATGGGAGQTNSGGNSGTGGSGGTGGAGAALLRIAGGDGGSGGLNGGGSTAIPNGAGGAGVFGGGGRAGSGTNTTGGAGKANSGGGGGAGFASTSVNGAAGGGAGEYVEIIINAPTTSYIYTVGAGGAGGAPGTSGGGAGGTGLIIVDEFYLRQMYGGSELSPANDNEPLLMKWAS